VEDRLAQRTKNRIFVHIPYKDRGKYLRRLIGLGINAELYFSAADLDGLRNDELESVRDALRSSGLECTVHGPYMDLCPGSPDPKIAAASKERISQGIDVASVLGAKLIVTHSGFDRRRYGDIVDEWLERSVAFWEEMASAARAEGLKIAVENTFDDGPDPLCRLVEALDPETLGFCLDVGHLNLFGRRSLDEWFESVRGRLWEVHLHDNFGETDEHLAIGEGSIDFAHLFALLSRLDEQPILTIEAHDEARVRRSLEALARLKQEVVLREDA